jgi:hypothetical protein
MKTILAGLLLIFSLMAVDTIAHAQDRPPCVPSQDMDKVLLEKYGESVVAAGIMPGQGIFYVTANPKTQTFTAFVRRPDGLSCIVMGGTGFAMGDDIAPKGPDL